MKKSQENKKTLIVSVIGILTLLITVVGSTYAFFRAQGGTSGSAAIEAKTATVDNLVFSTCGDVSITADMSNFNESSGSIKKETCATATLTAASSAAATYYYDISVNVETNELTYSIDDTTPELLLKITNPDGNEITSIDGLTYHSSVTDRENNTYSGFDITTLSGNQTLISKDEITAEASKTTEEKWTIEVVFVNYDNDQEKNTGKNFTGTIVIKKHAESSSSLLGVNYIANLVKSYDSASTDVITLEAPTSTGDTCTNTLAYDDYGNLRYVGANPCNYVSFNDETWRIIGIFDVASEEGGTTEKRIKLIRSDSLGSYSWDYTSSGSYTNDWSTSTLQKMLNSGAYYNRTTGTYYNNSTTATNVDFSSTGLTSTAQSQIADAVWNLGGTASYDSSSNGLASHWYNYERGTTVYLGRPTSWVGKVGLFYPSDYGYSTAGGSTTDRASCLAKELNNWDSSSYLDCNNNSWLYSSSYDQWSLSPKSDSSNNVFRVTQSGHVGGGNDAYYVRGVRPVVFTI